MTVDVTSTWEPRDLPVLKTAAHLFESGKPVLMSRDIASERGIETSEVIRALRVLGSEYLLLEDASTFGGTDYIVTGLTADGLRAVGQWPSPEQAADRLLARLDELIDETPDGSPKQSRLKQARDTLASMGRDLLVDVAGAAIGVGIGLGG